MFTGIVSEVGVILQAETSPEGSRLRIGSPKLAPQMEPGQSVSLNGVCLTVVERDSSAFAVEATPETLRRTNLGSLKPGSRVNLEPSARLSDFLGGHLVQGHVDEMGRVVSITEEGNSWIFRFLASSEVLRYCTRKGSVTVNGVSLTITDLGSDYFEVAIIPHTHEVTTFSDLREGDGVNLEADLISKYVESHVKRLGSIAMFLLVLLLGPMYGWAAEVGLHPNSILIYENGNSKTTHRFVVRIARPKPDLLFEWESVNDQGTVHVYSKALEESRNFTLLRLFEVGIDQEAPDETTLRLSRALFQELLAHGALKLRLNGTPLQMDVIGEESFALQVDGETVQVTGVRARDNRRGTWLFLKDAELPLVLAHETPYFKHRLRSISTPERPSLRWFRHRLPPIK